MPETEACALGGGWGEGLGRCQAAWNVISVSMAHPKTVYVRSCLTDFPPPDCVSVSVMGWWWWRESALLHLSAAFLTSFLAFSLYTTSVTALSWFRSYPTGRSQTVSANVLLPNIHYFYTSEIWGSTRSSFGTDTVSLVHQALCCMMVLQTKGSCRSQVRCQIADK